MLNGLCVYLSWTYRLLLWLLIQNKNAISIITNEMDRTAILELTTTALESNFRFINTIISLFNRHISLFNQNTTADTWWQTLDNKIIPMSNMLANTKLDKRYIFSFFVSDSTNKNYFCMQCWQTNLNIPMYW